ncbi:unnamed protein product [Peronospora belbahrii]|uniref:Uncharacterized protein n=1 Tax=Peronospora belbahrii TaxID=622444 RepID=A0ABN8D505_9STRA|nr:unnamed protein product [Peronospora belbahrii]
MAEKPHAGRTRKTSIARTEQLRETGSDAEAIKEGKDRLGFRTRSRKKRHAKRPLRSWSSVNGKPPTKPAEDRGKEDDDNKGEKEQEPQVIDIIQDDSKEEDQEPQVIDVTQDDSEEERESRRQDFSVIV